MHETGSGTSAPLSEPVGMVKKAMIGEG